MSVKVTAVIPVYNPGDYIEDCIASLLRQSLPEDEYEAIFVDDGSTDATPARLDRLAAEHPRMRVIHQENSGWPGKPRNVGIDAARGEFVMFVDNDDWLGDEALERMYEYGVENQADIVVGKMAGKGRPVPRELFRRNWPRATPETAPLIDSLTPHKMFRREFLDKHRLRFPEGRRRLEDHVFVAEAYLLASNVSVLSSYLCYHHIRRDDRNNSGLQRFDPVGYYTNLREALDAVERHTEPGPLRDRLFSRWLRSEMVERMRGHRLLRLPDGYRREVFNEIRDTVVERFGPGVVARLAPTQQLVAALIAADRFAEVEEFAHWETGITPVGRLEGLEWDGGTLRLGFTAEYQVTGEPMAFRSDDGRDLLVPPLAEETLGVIAELGADLTASVDRAKVDLVVRDRTTGAEFFQPIDFTRERVPAGDSTFRLVLAARSAIDPESAANGSPLGPGIWDVSIRIAACGWTKDARLGAARADTVESQRIGALSGSPARLVLPYWTEPHGNLSLDVDVATSRIERDARRLTPEDVTVDGDRLTVPLPLRLPEGDTAAVLRFVSVTGRTVEATGRLTGRGDGSALTVEVPAGELRGGAWELRFGVPSAKRRAPRWVPLPVELDAGAESGGLSIAESSVPSKAAALAASVRREPRASRSLLGRLARRARKTVRKWRRTLRRSASAGRRSRSR